MATLLFELSKHFMQLVPELVGVAVAVSFPVEPEFVQKFLLVWPHFVCVMIFPLVADPDLKRRILLVLVWHHAMATLLIELNELFMVPASELVILVNGVGAVIFLSKPKVFQSSLLILSKLVVVMKCPLMTDPLPC
jgi:hypothetical protein